MKLAVINSGGKQYIVQEGKKFKVEKLAQSTGDELSFADVLLLATDDNIQVGKPFVYGVKVVATVKRHGQTKKVTGVKMKAKKRQKHYFGHRQEFTEVEIEQIKSS